ncbi:MAG TPA: YbaK/EbsC family protein [Candidatus Nitrosotenuis sp.]|nr:YbaK/EbsC family protein [Candidatus Nitrosotenuis sp.]
METGEQRLKSYMEQAGIPGEHLVFAGSCHSVAEAAEAAGVRPEDMVKSICMVGDQDEWIVALIRGEDTASTTRLGRVLGIPPPRLASAPEILARTGYPCGGTPPFGYPARFVVDPRVLEKEWVYGGGGSPRSLVRVPSQALVWANQALVARIRR